MDSTGNVGIGTTSPAYPLDVNGRINSNTYYSIGGELVLNRSGSNVIYGSNNASDITSIKAGAAEAIRITTTGNVGIGTTDPAGYKLNIAGTGYLGAAAWVYSSDERLKNNISYLDGTSGLDKVMQLKPASFDYINGDKNNLGFIAQDVQKVIPEAVVVANQNTGMLGLKTDFIVPYLTKAIQEQQSEISNNQLSIFNQFSSANDQISSLTLKTDANVTTLTGLQKSVDDQLTIISTNQNETIKQIADLQNQIGVETRHASSLQGQIDAQQSLITAIQAQIAQLQPEKIQLDEAQITDNTNDIALLKLVLGFDVQNPNDVNISGKLEASEVVAGTMTIKVIDPNAKTIGTETIKAGEVEKEVDTTAITANSKVFVSGKSKKALSFPLTVTEIKEGTYFKVEIPQALTDDLNFDWWIVEQK